MTAMELLRRVADAGLSLSVCGEDHILVKGIADAIDALKPELVSHKPQIIAELRRRQEAVRATEWTTSGMVCAVCGRLGIICVGDRVCQRCVGAVMDPPRPDPTRKPPCSSFRGHPTQAHLPCQTCGHGWLAHHPALVASAIIAACAAAVAR
jgi:hypothetical protein